MVWGDIVWKTWSGETRSRKTWSRETRSGRYGLGDMVWERQSGRDGLGIDDLGIHGLGRHSLGDMVWGDTV